MAGKRVLKITNLNYRRAHITHNRIERDFLDTDILVIQEIQLNKDFKIRTQEIKETERKLNAKIYLSSIEHGSYIALIIKADMEDPEIKELCKGRALMMRIKNHEYEYEIINIYGPPKGFQEYKDFVEELFKNINNYRNVIMIGDWNCMLNEEMCNKGLNDEHKRKAKHLKHHWEDWIDVHDNLKQNIKYTYTKNDYRARLDRVYTKPNNMTKIINYKIQPTNHSDHDKVIIEIKWGDRPIWGKGIWKMNNTLLDNDDFTREVINILQIHGLNRPFYNPLEAWDLFKKRIKEAAITISIKLSKNKKQKMENLKKLIKEIQENIDDGFHTEENHRNLQAAKKQLEEEEIGVHEGERIRAHEEKTQNDEKPNKYFFNKEKSRGQTKQITILKDKDDNDLKEQEDIMTEIKRFYKELYTSQGTNQNQIRENLQFIKNKITDEDKTELNNTITDEEIKKAITDMNNDKSPGEDGITKEFYEHFYSILKHELHYLMNHVKRTKSLPNSQKNAIVKLLYKKNDHRKLTNWRPISLLNIDYKILSKIMTNRLAKIMDKITPTEQKCGVKGRQMTDVIRNIDSFRNNAEEGYLVLMDQQKAFDRVNHTYLFKVLSHLGITGDFLEITKTIYYNITSQILVNGKLTDKIEIKRGVRQGCPYSMLLFVLSSVPLINMIKEKKQIKGHKTRRNNIIKIQAYADDNTILIKHPKEIEDVYEVYKKHALASEAKINEDKTEIFRLTKNYKQKDENKEFQDKIKTQVKILGAIFHEDKEKETELNLTKPNKIIEQLKNNKGDYISIMGKIIKLQTYVYSTIYNNAWLINTNSKEFELFLKNVGEYLQRIKNREVLEKVQRKFNKGGLNLINIKERIETLKIKQILDSENQLPESDNIIYELGHKQKTIFNKNYIGPKIEIIPTHIKKSLAKLEPKIEIIRNYKQRHKNLPTKTLQGIIFEEPEVTVYKETLQNNNPKLTAINYLTAQGLLPIYNAVKCFFCKMEQETIDHIMLTCHYLKPLRDEVEKWLAFRNKNLNKMTVIYMQNIKVGIENEIISKYKETIWKNRIKATQGNLQPMDKIIRKLDQDIQNYIRRL